jgi:hypothetical protein
LREAGAGSSSAASQYGGLLVTGRKAPEKQLPLGSSIAQLPFASRMSPAPVRR